MKKRNWCWLDFWGLEQRIFFVLRFTFCLRFFLYCCCYSVFKISFMCTYTDIWYNHTTVLRCRLHIMFLETEKIVHLHSKSLFKVVLLDMKESKKLILSYNSKQCALASQIRCPFFSDFRALWDYSNLLWNYTSIYV